MTFSGTGATVIVADDDALIRMVLRRVLSQRGLNVVEAVDGAGVLSAAARHPVDLLVTDAHMPGLPLLETLKEIGQLDDAPAVLILSGDSATRMPSGVPFLAKPIDLDPFLETVQLLLDRRAAAG